jgi:hypothetical protein
VAVVVTCHEPYLKWLPGCLQSIDQQGPWRGERVVVFDGCQGQGATVPAGWKGQWGTYGGAAGAREAGLRLVRSPWVIWFDADNLMPPGYLAAAERACENIAHNVGMIYPDIAYHDVSLRYLHERLMPAWSLHELWRCNFVDTASCWRTEAVIGAGGWITPWSFQDWDLALRLAERGWTGRPLRGPSLTYRYHGGSQSAAQVDCDRAGGLEMEVRPVGIVTLLAGRRKLLGRWLNWLRKAELPRRCALYVIDNSGDARWGRRARDRVEALGRFESVAWLREETSPGPSEFARHQHVARLYNAALTRVREPLVATLEDDVEPPLDGLRKLWAAMVGRGNVGAMGAAYACPGNRHLACASMSSEAWVDPPGLMDAGRGQPLEVGMIGGGFTLYGNWDVQRALPLQAELPAAGVLGWDALLSRRIRQAGHAILLHGGVQAAHHVHGEVTR